MILVRSQETLVNSKFRIVAAGNLPAPGKCSVCGSVERDAVDFGLDIEFYGRVLICVECVHDAQSTVGELMGDNTEESPAASLSQMHKDAIYEYLTNADESIRRLLTLLPVADFDFTVDALDDYEEVPGNEPETPTESGTNDEKPGKSFDPFSGPSFQ